MAKATNKTAPAPSPKAVSASEYHSVNVRKIDNGYIVSRSYDGPKGYSCSETFSPTKPKIEVPEVKAAPKAAPKKR